MFVLLVSLFAATAASMLRGRLRHCSQWLLRLIVMSTPSKYPTIRSDITVDLFRIHLQQTTAAHLAHLVAHETLHNAGMSFLNRSHDQSASIRPDEVIEPRVHIVYDPIHLRFGKAAVVLAVQR